MGWLLGMGCCVLGRRLIELVEPVDLGCVGLAGWNDGGGLL
jgi:hypothetical protein